MASMVFDGLYIFAGAVLGLTIDDVKQFNPLYTVLITVSLMLCIYLITFLVRFITRKRRGEAEKGRLETTKMMAGGLYGIRNLVVAGVTYWWDDVLRLETPDASWKDTLLYLLGVKK